MGAELTGTDSPLASLQVGDPYVSARVGLASISHYQVGAKVVLTDTLDSSIRWEGKVSRIGEFSTDTNNGSQPQGMT